jgi:hypothetical protein
LFFFGLQDRIKQQEQSRKNCEAKKQQRQNEELRKQLNLDPNIPITFVEESTIRPPSSSSSAGLLPFFFPFFSL